MFIFYSQTASFFTLIIFFRENKLFQRGLGVFVLLCVNSGGVGGGGGVSVPYKYGKFSEVGGGGGALSEIPSVLEYGYFLEPHILPGF